jgi:hypothetical protein
LAELLDDISITIIVIDDQFPPNQQRPYQDRLTKVVASEGERWELIESFPQTKSGIVFPSSLHVYARRPVASLAIAAPAIRLDRLVALIGRDEQSGPSGKSAARSDRETATRRMMRNKA